MLFRSGRLTWASQHPISLQVPYNRHSKPLRAKGEPCRGPASGRIRGRLSPDSALIGASAAGSGADLKDQGVGCDRGRLDPDRRRRGPGRPAIRDQSIVDQSTVARFFRSCYQDATIGNPKCPPPLHPLDRCPRSVQCKPRIHYRRIVKATTGSAWHHRIG